ncbi:MAG: RNHCP domain-containing protein [Thermomicrobiales bacterium]|nr:RNHCP domain-containing protein [Thermomicrobiales bacterium]
MPRIAFDAMQDVDDVEFENSRVRSRRKQTRQKRRFSPPDHRTSAEEFKCGHCRTFVGPPISGGRHRNHCPLCLYSRHVDRQTPGDRLSDCRSLMEPVGTWFRRNGEQVIVHQCLGCGETRNCRVAADDYHVACMHLVPWTEPVQTDDQAAGNDEEIA